LKFDTYWQFALVEVHPKLFFKHFILNFFEKKTKIRDKKLIFTLFIYFFFRNEIFQFSLFLLLFLFWEKQIFLKFSYLFNVHLSRAFCFQFTIMRWIVKRCRLILPWTMCLYIHVHVLFSSKNMREDSN